MWIDLLFFGAIALVINLGVIAAVIYVCYRLAITAIKTAILEADAERQRRIYSSESSR